MLSEHDLFSLAAFCCQAISAVLTMATGVFALRNAFEDVHKIAMELPTRTPIGDSDREKLRKEARREFLQLLFWRCLPGAFLLLAGVAFLYLGNFGGVAKAH
jgi:hypothetical protein